MSHKRKAYTPFSTSSEAGTTTAPVEGYIDVLQEVKPTVDTGFVDSKGIWQGHVTSDKDFIAFGMFPAIANGATILAPYVNSDGTWPLNMTGFRTIQIGIRATNAGNYKMTGVMGPDSNTFANLSPVDPATALRLANGTPSTSNGAFAKAFEDDAEILTADVWEVFTIQDRLADQKLLQFQITNNSGDISTIETAFLRLV